MSSEGSSAEAICSALTPLRFLLRESEVYTGEDFYPSNFKLSDYTLQFMKRLESVREAPLQGAEEGDSSPTNDDVEEIDAEKIFLIRYAFGVRAVLSQDREQVKEAEAEERCLKEAGLIQFQIEAAFEGEYCAVHDLSEEDMDVFLEKNVPFNLWPFWREYVHNTCLRMGIAQPAVIPFRPYK